MTIKLNGSTAGSVALDAPASTTGNADIAFKLPIADGSADQVLKTDGSGNLAFAAAASGKLLKVHGGEFQFKFESSNSTFATVKALTVTPTKTGSKFVVLLSPSQMNIPAATAEIQAKCTDGTYTSGLKEWRNFDSNSIRFPATMVWYMDGSYTSGSAVTFTIQAARTGGSGTVSIGNNDANWKNTMLVLELDV